MSTILQLRHALIVRPVPTAVAGIALRTFRGQQDVDPWLELRHRAFAREAVSVRRWSAADFESEFLLKRWWQPDRLWFAETVAGLVRSPQIVGTVALAMRDAGESPKPVVHWLAVLPNWRRRGVGRLLLSALEAACWDDGFREVYLETHARWTAAGRFYKALGYESAS